jgi:hypothetical protein
MDNFSWKNKDEQDAGISRMFADILEGRSEIMTINYIAELDLYGA